MDLANYDIIFNVIELPNLKQNIQNKKHLQVHAATYLHVHQNTTKSKTKKNKNRLEDQKL